METRAWHGELSAEEEEERLAALVKEFKHEEEHERILPAQAEIMTREVSAIVCAIVFCVCFVISLCSFRCFVLCVIPAQAEIELRSATEIAERRRRHEGRLPREVQGCSRNFPYLKTRWSHESKKVGRARQAVIDRMVKLASERCRLDLDPEVEAAHVTLQSPQVGTTAAMVARSMRLPLDKLKQHRVRLKSDRNNPSFIMEDTQGMGVEQRLAAEKKHQRFLDIFGEEMDTLVRLTARHNVQIGANAAEAVRNISTSPQKSGGAAAPRPSPPRYNSPRRSVGADAGRIDLIKRTTGDLTRTLVAQMFERADAAFVGSPDKDVLRLSLRHGSGDSSTEFEETETGFEETGFEEDNMSTDDSRAVGGAGGGGSGNAGSGSSSDERGSDSDSGGDEGGSSGGAPPPSDAERQRQDPYVPTARGRAGTIANLQGIQEGLRARGHIVGSPVASSHIGGGGGRGEHARRGRSGTVANLQGIQADLRATGHVSAESPQLAAASLPSGGGGGGGHARERSGTVANLQGIQQDLHTLGSGGEVGSGARVVHAEEPAAQSIGEIMAAMASLQESMASIGGGGEEHARARRASVQLLGSLSTHLEGLGYTSPRVYEVAPEPELEPSRGGRSTLARSNTLTDVSTLQSMQSALRGIGSGGAEPSAAATAVSAAAAEMAATAGAGEARASGALDITMEGVEESEESDSSGGSSQEEEQQRATSFSNVEDREAAAVAVPVEEESTGHPVALPATPRRAGVEEDPDDSIMTTMVDGAAASPTRSDAVTAEEHSMSFGFDELSSSAEGEESDNE